MPANFFSRYVINLLPRQVVFFLLHLHSLTIDLNVDEARGDDGAAAVHLIRRRPPLHIEQLLRVDDAALLYPEVLSDQLMVPQDPAVLKLGHRHRAEKSETVDKVDASRVCMVESEWIRAVHSDPGNGWGEGREEEKWGVKMTSFLL